MSWGRVSDIQPKNSKMIWHFAHLFFDLKVQSVALQS